MFVQLWPYLPNGAKAAQRKCHCYFPTDTVVIFMAGAHIV